MHFINKRIELLQYHIKSEVKEEAQGKPQTSISLQTNIK